MDEGTCDPSERSEASDKLECAVCLQPCIQPVKLPCRHIFCYLCVKGSAQQSKRCAMCRQEIPVNYLDNPQLIAVEQPSVAFEGSYQWFYEGRNGWWQYDNRTSLEIENAYKKDESQCEVLVAGYVYIIDFEKKIQYRRCDPFRRRRITRDWLSMPKKGIAGIPNELLIKSENETATSSANSGTVCSSSDSSDLSVQGKLVTADSLSEDASTS